MNKELKALIKELISKWDKVKEVYKPDPLWWNNPNIIWLLITDNEEDYEGSQEQYGVDKNGVLRYEYQSHCSCNSYEDGEAIPEEFLLDTKKSFSLLGVDQDISDLLIKKIKDILLLVK